jgi:hypothetical protein
MQITDNANGNRHSSPVFNSPGEYGAAIYSQNGTFRNAVFEWENQSYVASSGYYLGNDPRVFQDWMLSTSSCTNQGSTNFVDVTDKAGPVNTTNLIPAGVKPQNIETCDGTDFVHWPVNN